MKTVNGILRKERPTNKLLLTVMAVAIAFVLEGAEHTNWGGRRSSVGWLSCRKAGSSFCSMSSTLEGYSSWGSSEKGRYGCNEW